MKLASLLLLCGAAFAQMFPFPGPGLPASADSGNPITLIAHVIGPATPATNGGTSASIDTTGADFLVVALSLINGTTPAFSDSKGNTYTQAAITSGGSLGEIALLYVQAPIVGSGHNFYCGQPYADFAVAAFSGMKTSGVLNTGTTSTAQMSSATSIQAGGVTPPPGHQLVIAGITMSAVGLSLTIGSSYTITDQRAGGGPNYGSALAYLIQSAGASTNPTWTQSGSGGLEAAIASFGGN